MELRQFTVIIERDEEGSRIVMQKQLGDSTISHISRGCSCIQCRTDRELEAGRGIARQAGKKGMGFIR